jgi:phosphohistidine phosphatase SixA
MNQSKIKLWVGVGAYLLSGVASTVIVTQANAASAAQVDPSSLAHPAIEPPQSPLVLAHTPGGAKPATPTAQGGEGGEGGEGGAKKPEFQNKLSGAALVSALQRGGYVIYFRHAQTDKDYADQADAKLDLKSCATQRTLSETGWQQARAIGQAFQMLKIPVDKVIASDYCRAWQTADLAFGRYEKNSRLNFLPHEEFTPDQLLQMKTAIMPLLVALPASGKNTVIVGHDDVFKAATGIYPEPQGMAYILKPNGKGFEMVAGVLPDAWDKMK